MSTKQTISVAVPKGLADRARNAVYRTPGATMTALVAAALEAHVKALEDANGGAFTPRPEKRLQPGRRAG